MIEKTKPIQTEQSEEKEKQQCPVPKCEFSGTALELMNHLTLEHKYTDKQALQICYSSVQPGESALVKAAKEAGAVEVITKESMDSGVTVSDDISEAFDKAPTTKDVIGTGKLEFHNELPQVDFKDLVGETFLLQQIKMVENWDGFYGTSTFGLIMIQLRDGRKATSLAGGLAVVKQLRGFISKKRFPVKVTLTEKPGSNGYYYLFE